MDNKKIILIIGALIIFISVIGAYASEYNPKYGDLNYLLDEINETDLTGCCSVVCQMDGNNSMFAFRRDAGYAADIFVEKIDWHGKEAIKQYKTDGKYFCQVIVTNDGWTIGYGGLDDGDDNKKIENITGEMVANNDINNKSLQEIQDIKKSYGRGHVLIKAPDGRYGVAMGYSHFTGHLNPGQYISVPNKESFVRTGNIQMNASDKVQTMHKLAISDSYGLSRRDVSVYDFYHLENKTFNGNITDITLSNDDGSSHGMSTGGLSDNFNFNGTLFKKEDIPIAPKYQHVGNVTFAPPEKDNPLGWVFNLLYYLVMIIIFIVLFVIIIRIINRIRYARKRKRQSHSLYPENRRYR